MTTREARTERPSLRTWFRVPALSRVLELRRDHRRRVAVIGHVVRVFGLLLAGLIFTVGLPLIILLASAHGGAISSALPEGSIVAAIVTFPFLIVVIGTFMIAGKKRTILFLRRFGNPELSERIRLSLESLLHSHYRLVALDDSTMPAMGVPTRRFRRIVLLIISVGLCLVLAVGALLLWVRYMGNESADVFAVLTAVAAVIMLVPLGGVALFMLPSVYYLRGRARRAAYVVVEDENGLELASRKVRSQKRWFNALSLNTPQALILGTSDEFWRATVQKLLPVVDAVIVDLSEPTENIEWEINEVAVRCPEKCIVIGNRDAIRMHVETPQNEATARIFDCVAGAQLVTYAENEPPDPRELLVALDAAGARHDGRPPQSGRYVVAAIEDDAAAWDARSVNRFLDRRYGPTLMTTAGNTEDIDANVEKLRTEYPHLEVTDLRGIDTNDRLVLIPAQSDPLFLRAEQRLRTRRRFRIGIAVFSLLVFLGAAAWTYHRQSSALEFHALVGQGSDWLDIDPHHAGRLAMAALAKHDGHEAFELLFDALERTRPFVKLTVTRGRSQLAPDGATVLGLCPQGVCVWDTDGKLIRTLSSENLQVQAAGWHPDGRIVTASMDGLVRIWTDHNDVERQQSGTPGSKADWINVSPDGRYVAFADGNQSNLRLWDLSTNELSMPVGDSILAVTWNAESTSLVVLTNAEVLHIHPGEPIPAHRLKVSAPKDLQASHDGRYLLVSSFNFDSSVLIDTTTWETRQIDVDDGTQAVFHPHENWFVARIAGDRTFAVFGPDGSTRHRKLGTRTPELFAFNPSGTRLLVGGQQTQLYKIPEWDDLLILGRVGAEQIDRLAITENDRALMTGRGEATIWDLRPQPPRRLSELPPGTIASFAWRPDGERFAVVHEDGLLFDFNRMGEMIRRVELPPIAPAARVTYRGDGSVLVTDGYAPIGTGGRIWVLDAGDDTVRNIAPLASVLVGVSPSGATTAWGSRNGPYLTFRGARDDIIRTIHVEQSVSSVTWNRSEDCVVLVGDKEVEIICPNADLPSTVIVVDASEAFIDSSGARLAVTGEGFAELYDLRGDQLVRIEVTDVDDSSPLLRWSPNAKWLVCITETGQVRIYNDKGALVLEDSGAGGKSPWVSHSVVAWDPDSLTLYVDHMFGGPWIWHPNEPKLTTLLETRPYEALEAAFSPNGASLLVGTRGGLELWLSEPLIEVAKRRLGYLDAEDREGFKR